MPIVSRVIAYDIPGTGKTIVLHVHQAIHMPTMTNNLLNLMQMQASDIMVNEVPKCMVDSPSDDTHSIQLQDHDVHDTINIPLELRDVISCFFLSSYS